MTYKYIIDGVDVSGCEWIREVGLDSEYICTCNSPNKTSGYCKYNPNCRYKQLKRKEQECNRLKQTLAEIKEIAERCGKRIPLFEIDEIAEDLKQILQKISEVEDEN